MIFHNKSIGTNCQSSASVLVGHSTSSDPGLIE